jgi:hypothetical protein
MYQKTILDLLAKMNRSDVAPRLVEAWMRLSHGTLDRLSAAAFAEAVDVAVICIDDASPEDNESLAKSYGL